MRKNINFLFAVALGFAAIACSSPEKMAEMAENVTVKCEPAVLEVVGGEIDATVSVTYPADYFQTGDLLGPVQILAYLCYGGMCNLPLIIDLMEDRKWNALRSKI